MAPSRGVAEPFKCRASMCRPPPAGREIGPGFSGRMGTQDPPEQTAGQTLHALQLMIEARPQPPSLFFIHSWQLLEFSPHRIGTWDITVPSCSQDRFKSPLLSRSDALDSFQESLCKPDPQVLLTFLSASAPSRGDP
jgi:hypothetical protein